ncbi:hypothetical protein [Ensifer adhaerens]|uniref:hypothetical protein n=1 Tax=Ensifer adhaerens TaxID=106592 RepID=UPI0015C2EDFD|nr:hypothetical protein [Ensifer adhaerens]
MSTISAIDHPEIFARACRARPAPRERRCRSPLNGHDSCQPETVGDLDLFKKISAIPQFFKCHNLAITTVADRRNSVQQQPVSGLLLRSSEHIRITGVMQCFSTTKSLQ